MKSALGADQGPKGTPVPKTIAAAWPIWAEEKVLDPSKSEPILVLKAEWQHHKKTHESYDLAMTNIAIETGHLFIVGVPIQNGDFP